MSTSTGEQTVHIYHVHEIREDYAKIRGILSNINSSQSKDYQTKLFERIRKINPEFALPFLLLDQFGNYQISSKDCTSLTTVQGNIISLEWEQNKRLEDLIFNVLQGKPPSYNGKVKAIIELEGMELYPVTMKIIGTKYKLETHKIPVDFPD